MDMKKVKKYINLKTITAIGIIVGIVGGSIAIWQNIKTKYKLEANIISIDTPLSPELAEILSKFDIKAIRKSKEIPEIETITEETFEKVKPIFEKTVKSKIEFYSKFSLHNTTIAIIQNKGKNTLNDVQLKCDRFAYSCVRIINDSGKETILKDVATINIGTMPPRSDVTIYIYRELPIMLLNAKLTHSNGIGKINFYGNFTDMNKIDISSNGFYNISYWLYRCINFAILACIIYLIVLIKRLHKSQSKAEIKDTPNG